MKTFAILGHPVAHSLSPQLHNAVFAELDLQDCEYTFLDTAPENLPAAVSDLRQGKYEGFSVTIPHKQAIIPLLDQLTDRAQKVGAVNTVIKQGEKLLGDNTDYSGFKKSLEEVQITSGEGQHALVLGSGGAAQAVIAVLIDLNFQVTVASRDPEKAQEKSDKPVQFTAYSNLDPHQNVQLIVNTTPVGMHPKVDASPLEDPSWFTPDRIYVDIIYNPKVTQLLSRAQQAGAKIITGDRMFLWQAVEQARYFCDGEEPPVELMETIV